MKMSFGEWLHGFPGDVKPESPHLLGRVSQRTGSTPITVY